MFSTDLSSRKARLALRFFTYGVMTISTIVITVIMIFFALGYRFDNNFNFNQGGLVQFRSFPDGAKVKIDDKMQSFNTPNKKNLSAGQHTVSLSLEGYRSWSKPFDLAAGQLLWLNYARLVPESIKTDNVREFAAVVDSVASPDRKWALIQLSASEPKFILVNATDEKALKFTDVSVPDSFYDKRQDQPGKFSIVEWDLKSQYVLIKHVVGGSAEFLRIDRSKISSPVNLTKLFGLQISQAHFSGSNADTIYANTSGVLRRLSVNNKSASGVLVDNIEDFTIYGDGAAAFVGLQNQTIGDDATKQKVIGVWKNDKTTIVRHVDLNDDPVISYSEYDDHSYLAIGDKKSQEIQLVRDPFSAGSKDQNADLIKIDLGADLKWLSFSGNGRMLVAQNDNHFSSYDIEESKTYKQVLDLGSDIRTPLKWLDDFYLLNTDGGKLRILEFDGTNAREIVSTKPKSPAFLSSNGERIFSFAESNDKMSLQSSLMIIDK